MTVTWASYEQHLCRLAESDIEDGNDRFVTTLLVFDGDEAELMIRARSSRPRDERDPLSELATYVAARRPTRVALAIPGRLRHLTDRTHDGVLATGVACSSVEHRNGRFEHRARVLQTNGATSTGGGVDLEVELSPVASLLDDALRFPSPVGAPQTLSVLMAWGHVAAVPAARHDPATDDRVPPPSGGDRHRVHRLAIELGRRHTPTGPVTDIGHRPAVFTDVPSGWLAACPL